MDKLNKVQLVFLNVSDFTANPATFLVNLCEHSLKITKAYFERLNDCNNSNSLMELIDEIVEYREILDEIIDQSMEALEEEWFTSDAYEIHQDMIDRSNLLWNHIQEKINATYTEISIDESLR